MPDEQPAIDPRTAKGSGATEPYNRLTFDQMRITDTWAKYDGILTWGQGQCLAILDDGCDLEDPAWRVPGKVVATWNAVDGNDDCRHVPPGYHGTTVGHPSSMHLNGVRGVAYQNQVAHVRIVSVVHLTRDESASMAAGLRWVRDHRERFNITAVNLAPVDDQRHQGPVPTAIDAELHALREAGVWVSAPTGNHHYTDGISWPACQPDCFAIGATVPGRHEVHLDRYTNVDVLVVAPATSSSNAYAAACSQILREAIDKAHYPWRHHGPTLPEVMMAIFRQTGVPIHDPATGMDFRELDLLAAVDHVFGFAHQPSRRGLAK